MPGYVWNCLDHGQFDKTYRMADKPSVAPCPKCGVLCVQVPVIGGIQGDEPSWLFEKEVQGCLLKPGDKPIENRTQYKKHLRDNGIGER